ncbi:MAG: hypothetical protein IPJ69_02025 [Deltaproteobacteria bacterium]|nr:MAG: hypothetical protein IPJ69_02025 [Deltaproteobacteria bacterium]
MVSQKFQQALKLSEKPAYKLAWSVGIHPNTLSKLTTGYLRVKHGDERLIKIGSLLGLSPNEVFDPPISTDTQ